MQCAFHLCECAYVWLTLVPPRVPMYVAESGGTSTWRDVVVLSFLCGCPFFMSLYLDRSRWSWRSGGRVVGAPQATRGPPPAPLERASRGATPLVVTVADRQACTAVVVNSLQLCGDADQVNVAQARSRATPALHPGAVLGRVLVMFATPPA